MPVLMYSTGIAKSHTNKAHYNVNVKLVDVPPLLSDKKIGHGYKVVFSIEVINEETSFMINQVNQASQYLKDSVDWHKVSQNIRSKATTTLAVAKPFEEAFKRQAYTLQLKWDPLRW